jgi:hypothetical protein
MTPKIALDMFRGNFPFPPNFHFLLIVWVSAALHNSGDHRFSVSIPKAA